MQLFLFGYAINADPKHLPTGLLSVEHSKYERTIVAALKNTGYYDIRALAFRGRGGGGLAEGELMFVRRVFRRLSTASVDRGEKPTVLIDADATDPSAIGNAAAALALALASLDRDLPPIRQARREARRSSSSSTPATTPSSSPCSTSCRG